MTPRIVLVAFACAFVYSPASQGQTAALTGTVSPSTAFSISFRDASGARVTHLDVGTYTITVNDQGDIHNFHLLGPGVNELTEIEGTGTVTWTVTFRDGIYTYRCDPHQSSMRGRFAVGTATLPTPPPPATVTRLSGKIGPGTAIRLNNASGRRVTRVKAGRYRITVQDVSKTQNFHLSGPGGVNRKTGVAFKGTTSWTVSLRAGKYTYRSDASKNVKGTLVVTAASSTHAGHGR